MPKIKYLLNRIFVNICACWTCCDTFDITSLYRTRSSLNDINFFRLYFYKYKILHLSTNTLKRCFWLQVFVLVNVENDLFACLSTIFKSFIKCFFEILGMLFYCTWHLFLPLMKYFRRLYLARNSSCFALMAPRRFLRINSTASSYFIPNSTKATATKTGALPKPVTQWTPTQTSASSSNSWKLEKG